MMKKTILTIALIASITAVKAQQLPQQVKVSTNSVAYLQHKLDSLSRVISGTALPGNVSQPITDALYQAISPLMGEAQRSVKMWQDSLAKVKPVKKP